MLKILKNLKESFLLVIAIVILLCVQATADLKLPDYTSKIVNTGIQQGGIEYAVPNVIRKQQIENITYFIDNDESILNSYEKLEITQENLEKYPELQNQDIYKLKNDSKENKEELQRIVAKPLMILYQIENSKNVEDIKKQMLANIDENNPQYLQMLQMNILNIIKSMPEEQRKELI